MIFGDGGGIGVSMGIFGGCFKGFFMVVVVLYIFLW